MDLQYVWGSQDVLREFESRNEKFLSRFANLKATFDKAFVRSFNGSNVDRVLFFMGRLCLEDFFEILLLSANGYGDGALKILRGLFERAVTLVYLNKHTDEVDDFLNYHHVAQHKLLAAIKNTFGDDAVRGKLPRKQKPTTRTLKNDI